MIACEQRRSFCLLLCRSLQQLLDYEGGDVEETFLLNFAVSVTFHPSPSFMQTLRTRLDFSYCQQFQAEKGRVVSPDLSFNGKLSNHKQTLYNVYAFRSPGRTTAWQKSRSSFLEGKASAWTKTTGGPDRAYFSRIKATVPADCRFLRINSSALLSLDEMTLFYEYF